MIMISRVATESIFIFQKDIKIINSSLIDNVHILDFVYATKQVWVSIVISHAIMYPCKH